MSVPPVERDRSSEVVSGFLAAVSLTASAIAWAYTPVLLAPFGLLVAFLAAGLGGGRHDGLVRFAVWFGALSWVAGMTIAVLTENPLY